MKGTKEITKGSLAGKKINVEDTWLNVFGSSWMFANGNAACLQYAMRASVDKLPTDDNVYYGKIDGLGYLVHESEIS